MRQNEEKRHFDSYSHQTWDIIIIGGGATGAGIAFDAVSRGFKTILLEQADFGKGTSSRSTKLIHGGVRYLAQGNLRLVFEALHERGLILKIAPHIASNQEFLVPVFSWWERFKYTTGLKCYDLLAGNLSLGKSTFISKEETIKRLPNLKPEGLKGAVIYHDGKFDDARYLISLIGSIREKGGATLNYCKVTGLNKDIRNRINGVTAIDTETDTEYTLNAGVVINATGVFADEVLKMDQQFIARTIRPSQGIHIVVGSKFLPGKAAVMIPKTDDGRVLFAIPWYDSVLTGTTDTQVDSLTLEPKALDEEIRFILHTASQYFCEPPGEKDILTVFAGLRPLIASPDNPSSTRDISRKHSIAISSTGLVTVEGGKWTIYRRMAQDALDKIIRAGMLENRPCITQSLTLYDVPASIDRNDRLLIYGKFAGEIRELIHNDPQNAKLMHPLLPYTKAEIIWICRNELPRKLEDVLARRTRALFLHAKASLEMAAKTASIMANELGFDKHWEHSQMNEYKILVQNYIFEPGTRI